MAAPELPSHIAHFSIVELLGVGASSNVYLAMEQKTLASVALKQLRKTCRTPAHYRLLENEIRLAARVAHDNVARLVGSDMHEPSGPYLLLEYVRGVPLIRHQHPDTLLPLRTVVSIGEQIGRALAHCAEMGIVHRDVKPENLILMPNGRAKLIDFGCAIESGTTGEMVAGSLAYMPPEQLQGEVLDARTDIYALGAVLYRLLCGHNTFEAEDEFEARIAVLNYPATPLTRHRPDLPVGLVELVHAALQKDRAQRFQNWTAMLDALGEVAHQLRLSDEDYDVYRGFSLATQNAIHETLSASRQYSRSGFSRSLQPGHWAE
ncbi:MAG: hypothetical protein Fur0040_08290 [Sideroxydans sp.]